MTIDPVYHEAADDLDPVRLDPFTQTNWKSVAARDQWAEVFAEMGAAKAEAEWRSVLDDETDRQVAIIHVNNYNREQWMERIGKHDLFYKPIRYSKPYDGYSHKHFPTDIHDLERTTYSVISTDEEACERVYQAEKGEENHVDHSKVGEHLGFPDCCRAFFDRVWIDEGKIDPIYEVACNTESATPIDGDPENLRIEDPNPGANILWRYFGPGFITHIPCSWDCKASIEIARNRYRIMSANGYEEAAHAMYEWLDSPHVWTGYHGICHVRNRHMTASSTTSSYWSQKRVVWGEKHEPGGSII